MHDTKLGACRGLTNREVVRRWLAGRRAMSKSMTTDGTTIWSFMVPIAVRKGDQVEISPEMEEFWSRTTSYHLRLVLVATGLQM